MDPDRKALRAAAWGGALTLSLVVLFLMNPRKTLAQEEATEEGHQVFVAAKCHTCHAVASASIAARAKEEARGPDLGGYVTDDATALARYLRREEERDGDKHKARFRGTDEELGLLLAWLGEQEPHSESDGDGRE